MSEYLLVLLETYLHKMSKIASMISQKYPAVWGPGWVNDEIYKMTKKLVLFVKICTASKISMPNGFCVQRIFLKNFLPHIFLKSVAVLELAGWRFISIEVFICSLTAYTVSMGCPPSWHVFMRYVCHILFILVIVLFRWIYLFINKLWTSYELCSF